jgi:hypothetical protein
MTIEPEPTAATGPQEPATPTLEESLRQRVSMLTQLLIIAGIIVVLQFGIMLKVLMEAPK